VHQAPLLTVGQLDLLRERGDVLDAELVGKRPLLDDGLDAHGPVSDGEPDGVTKRVVPAVEGLRVAEG
jgi:hypothetical protein